MEQSIEERFGLCKHCLCDTDRYCHRDCHIYSKYCGAVEQKQIDDVKYKKLRELAYAMYIQAQYLSTDGGGLRKAMENFYRYINYEE